MRKNITYTPSGIFCVIFFAFLISCLMGLITINLFPSFVFKAGMYEVYKQEPLFIKVFFCYFVGIIGTTLGFLFFLLIAFSLEISKRDIEENEYEKSYNIDIFKDFLKYFCFFVIFFSLIYFLLLK